MPSESVTEDKSIINGTSSMAAKPAVSTFSSLLVPLEDFCEIFPSFLVSLEESFF
jgi:hypothetical protein